MKLRLRVLPVAIIATVGLLGVKLGNLWLAFDAAPVATAQAQQAAEKPPAAAAAPPAQPKPAEKPPAPAMPAGGEKAVDPLAMSPAEVELLQKLAERRAELDRRAAELSQREVLMQATEKRIDEKIARLQALERDIGGIVDKQAEEDDARLKSLVKIYETMKPRDAARIFEQLDLPVLLGVVEHMKERSAAPILAAMDPSKARTVTLALAERKDQRAGQDAAHQSPPKAPSSPDGK
jgi:flagellar motility protein MotE (MotC chaperone)